MPASSISFEKYLNQLDMLIQKVEKEQDEEALLVQWLKIYRITKDAAQIKNLESNKLLLLKRIQQRFNQEITPILVRFRKVNSHTSMREYLDHYTRNFFHQVDEAEKNMKTLPLRALESLEDLLFFVNLYSFRLQNTEIPRILKDKIKQKIKILLKDFEVEGGSKTLLQEQAKITEGLKNTLQKSPVPVESEEKNKSDFNEETTPSAKTLDESDIMLNQLIYPEEPTREEVQNKKLVDPESLIRIATTPESRSDSNPMLLRASLDGNPISSQVLDVFPYSTWVPYAEWANFTKYRYCLTCGKIIHPETLICTGCNKAY